MLLLTALDLIPVQHLVLRVAMERKEGGRERGRRNKKL